MAVTNSFPARTIAAQHRKFVFRSGNKYRINRGQEFVIGGYVPDNPFDSIIVGYYQDGKLLYTAKVRNGFVRNPRREVAAKLKGLQIDTCPFANLPERKRTQWALTREENEKLLRHSKFIGLGEDKDPRQVGQEAWED